MINKLFFTAGESLFQAVRTGHEWRLEKTEVDHEFHCLAADPKRTGRLYGGTFDHGLWISDNDGKSWQPAGEGIAHRRVLSVAVSPTEAVNGYSVVWAGTEPSMLYRSEDGGATWTDFPNLINLPSEPKWSFPPRPHTHHVSSIQPDLHHPDRIFVGIELGGVMKSEDKGETWEDRKPGSQFDCHILTMTKQAAGRVYEAGGGGFAETTDTGKTWETMNAGLSPYTYLVDIAVDSADPHTIIASAAKSARTAYNPERAHTVLVRKEKDSDWQIIEEGLPERDGSSVFSLVNDETEPHVFYAVNNTGIYQSKDAGKSWHLLEVEWPQELCSKRIRGFISQESFKVQSL